MKIDNVFTGWYAINKVLMNNLGVNNELANSSKDLEVSKQNHHTCAVLRERKQERS